MAYQDIYTELPCPERQGDFYDGVLIKRALAWVVDVVLIMALVVPVVVLTAFIGLFFLPVLFIAVGFVYRWATLAGGSATWGMRLMAIEFRDLGGRRLRADTAFLHTLGYSVMMSTLILQVISIGMMLVTERRQGLHDIILGTVALNRRG